MKIQIQLDSQCEEPELLIRTAAVTADLTPAEAQAMQDYMARMDATLCRRLAEKGETP